MPLAKFLPHSASILATTPVINLDDQGRPLSFPRVLTGPDAASWLLAAGADLRMLFVTSKCLVPTHSPSSTPTYFKNVVKEKFIGDTVDIMISAACVGQLAAIESQYHTVALPLPLVCP